LSLVARLYVLVALAVLPAILIQGWSELSLRRTREAQVHEEALRLAEFAASEINGLIDGAGTLLSALARAPSVRQGDAAACTQLLDDVGRDLERYVGLGVVDGSGRWTCAQGGLPKGGIDSADRPWFRAGASRNGFHVGDYTVSRRLGVGVLPITLPLADGSGRPAGLVGLSLDLDWLARRLAARSLPPGASFGITDRNGTLVVRLPDRELVGRPMREEYRWMLAAARPGTLAGVGPDATRRVVGYVPPAAMADGALLVSVGLSTEQALAGVEAATRRGILMMTLSMILALLAARLAGSTFVLQPVRAMLGAAERWRAGDLAARVGPAAGTAEFGRLGSALDGMAADLEAHGREIDRTMEALRESEERFRQFADNSHDVLWMYDGRSRRLDFVSRAFAEIWGRAPEDVASGAVLFETSIHPDDRAAIAQALPDALAGKEVTVTYRVLRPDGSVRWVRDSGFPIRDAAGRVIRAGGICRDVTAWKAIELDRERALREREVMLREINHRVKNNLQVIISLLRLQASRSAKPEVREAFDEACGRVSTITELHAALFDGAQIGTIDFGRYLHELCARLESGTRGGHGADVGVQVDAVPGTIDLDRAVPLGLIVNELVTNAVKHGFVDGGTGTVRVRFERRDGLYRLSVRDDGRGVAGGVGGLREGLGMQLVHGFVRRIRGSLTIVGEPGFEAVIAFPVESQPGKAAGRA
jgi:PAS domain S-box-containing protein